MKLRILIAHTKYQQKGGEDKVAETEAELLEKNGHAVQMYLEDNKVIPDMSRFRLAFGTIWSIKSTRRIKKLIKEFQPDIIHCHNTFPLMSPSIYWAAKRYEIPVVQTLHNYRLLCPQAMLLRNGNVCEDCIGHLPWRSIFHKCYHASILQSAVVTSMLGLHRLINTYQSKVSAYIALSKYSRNKFIEGGLPEEKIHVKSNFVDIKYIEPNVRKNGLFVGRLSPEKGLECLALAAKRLQNTKIYIVGSGPMETRLSSSTGLVLMGWKDPSEVYSQMRNSAYLVVPSIWHETFGLIVIEAFANGLPVIASRIGALAELIEDGYTGLLFEPGSSDSLYEKISWAEMHPDELMVMGKNARNEYVKRYTPQVNYNELMNIYKQIQNNKLRK